LIVWVDEDEEEGENERSLKSLKKMMAILRTGMDVRFFQLSFLPFFIEYF